MNESQAVQWVLFQLNMEPKLAAITISRLDFDDLKNMSEEAAREEIEYNVADRVLVEETSLKLNPLLVEAGIQVTPEQTQEVTEKMYSDAAKYPLEKLLSNYTELDTVGAASEAFLKANEIIAASGVF